MLPGICHWMDIGIEEAWSSAGPRLFPALKQPFDPKVFDSEQLAMVWAGPTDCVILRNMPEPAWLEYLEARGLALPRMHVLNKNIPVIEPSEFPQVILPAADRGLALRPYVVTRETFEFAHRHAVPLMGGHWQAVLDGNNKVLQNALLRRVGIPVPEGAAFANAAALLAHLEQAADGALGCVLKTPFGASGKALFRVDRREKLAQLKHVLGRKAGPANEAQPLLYERWYDVRRSVSYTLDVTEGGGTILGFVREQIVVNGVYRGFRYSRSLDSEYRPKLAVHAAGISRALHAAGVRDIANIDAIETVDGHLFPAVDINVRFSLAMYFERCVMTHEYARALYFDAVLDLAPQELLSRTSRIEKDTGAAILIASVSRPDRHGLSRIFVLFAAARLGQLDEAQRSWCGRMSIPDDDVLFHF